MTLLFAKLAVSISVVLGLSILAERTGPRAAGVLSGYPLGTAILLYFIGLEQGVVFATESAVYALPGLIATLAFLYAYYLTSRLLSDCRMILQIPVSSVAAFGAFVDIGVHQDGLVHVSQLADRFVKDPHEVVKAGDVVRVRVTEVDVPRKRIGLTMRKDAGRNDAGDTSRPRSAPADKPKPRGKAPMSATPKSAQSQGAFGSALADAFKRQGPK